MELRINNLSLQRGSKRLQGQYSFVLRAGEILCLCGANGSGKTSFLRTLAGLCPPAAGEIFWQNQNTKKDQSTLCRALAFLPSANALLPTLPASAQGIKGNTPEWQEAGIAHMHAQPISAYSSGQQKKLALLRVLQLNRPLWLLDEPEAALDVSGIKWLQEKMAAHCASNGMIIAATHSPQRWPHALLLECLA